MENNYQYTDNYIIVANHVLCLLFSQGEKLAD